MTKKDVLYPDLHLDVLPPATRKAFQYCSTLPMFGRSDWYLAGGTALALHIGHRQSVDLDFFTSKAKFSELSVERMLLATGNWNTSFRQEGTVYGKLMDAKMSLIAYPFFVHSAKLARYGTIRILMPEDIAAMKVIAISQRGRKRDFVDLYWYCKNREPLSHVIQSAIRQYPGQKHNVPHFIKSLTYFNDAEADPMPKIFFDATWKQIKLFFQREAVVVTRTVMGLK